MLIRSVRNLLRSAAITSTALLAGQTNETVTTTVTIIVKEPQQTVITIDPVSILAVFAFGLVIYGFYKIFSRIF